jgi:hypothetical protein
MSKGSSAIPIGRRSNSRLLAILKFIPSKRPLQVQSGFVYQPAVLGLTGLSVRGALRLNCAQRPSFV